MFRQLSKSISTKRLHSNRGQRRTGLHLEALEDRTVLSTNPVLFATLAEAPGEFSNTVTAARPVKLAATMETQVTGKLTNSTDTDIFQVSLKAGQIFSASIDAKTVLMLGAASPMVKITLLNTTSAPVAGSGADGSLAYRVPTSGTYYIKLSSSVNATNAMSYTLHLRPMGLDNTLTDAKWLQQTGGGMYAWLDGSTLDISGPTGHGFGIRGNWQESTTRNGNLIKATYTATDTVFLQTAAGEVAMHVPGGGAFKITTQPQVAGDLFGEVDSINWNASVSLPEMASVFGTTAPFGFDLEQQTLQVNLSTTLSNPAGVKLGRETILQQTGAPVNAAVPYLYFTVNPLGGGTGGGMTNVLSIVTDPADPYMYIGSGVTGVPIPGTTVTINALAYSKNGLIPYTPEAAPSQWQGNLSGHFYIDAAVDFLVAGVPTEVEGNLTLNLDPKHTGRTLGGVNVTAEQLVGYLTKTGNSSLAASQADTVFSNVSLGINGELKMAVLDKLFHNLFKGTALADKAPPLTVGNASLIYDGPTHSGYFHGGTVNPLAGTPLAILGSQYTLAVDAAIKGNGSAYLDIQGNYQIAGFPATGHLLMVNEYPVTTQQAHLLTGLTYPPTKQLISATGIYVDQNVGVLGNTVDLTGRVLGNGDFSLQGSVNIHVGILDGTAFLTLSKTQAQGFVFTAGMQTGFKTDLFKGSVSANVLLGRSNGHTTFSGSGNASVSVRTPFGWKSLGSAGVTVSGNDLWFYANGQQIKVHLPG